MNLAVLLAVMLAAVDRPVIDLSGGRIQPLPLAIAKPLGSQETGTAIEAVLAQDFERSGLFRLLDPASFLAPPDEGMTGIDYSKWQTVGAQALIKMSCDASPDVNCEMRLYDVARGQELLHGTYTAPRPALRLAAHRFGDDVVRFFTREPGVFQTRIAWVREGETGKQVMVSDWDGFGVQPLTGASIHLLASWSPDGKRVAFVSERAGTPQIYTMAADGSDVRRITFQGNYNQEPAWSPKGDLIAFSGRDEHRVFDLYTVAVDTGKVTRLTQNQGTNEKPAWAPNGRYLLFSSTRSGKRQVWMSQPDGSNQRPVTSEKVGAADPAWGPLPGK